MSKKIAEGTAALVLDVKVGSGAFMRDIADARLLAQTMVTLGEEHGVRTTALLTRMDAPLGLAVGNAVEVQEAVATLRGDGPPDLVEVTLALAAEMLALAGLAAGAVAGAAAGDPVAALADGRALDRYRAMIAAQGGDPDAPLPQAAHAQVVTAAESGWLRRLDARAVGMAAWRLGRGPGQEGTSGERGRGSHLPGQARRPGRPRPAPAGAARGRRVPVRWRAGCAGERDRDRLPPAGCRLAHPGAHPGFRRGRLLRLPHSGAAAAALRCRAGFPRCRVGSPQRWAAADSG